MNCCVKSIAHTMAPNGGQWKKLIVQPVSALTQHLAAGLAEKQSHQEIRVLCTSHCGGSKAGQVTSGRSDNSSTTGKRIIRRQ